MFQQVLCQRTENICQATDGHNTINGFLDQLGICFAPDALSKEGTGGHTNCSKKQTKQVLPVTKPENIFIDIEITPESTKYAEIVAK